MMAALLHDVIEDQDVKKEELVNRFGASVALLVDGLSKLRKIEFKSYIEAQAENFRKMLLAMARDVRVILVKLADRLHNMRTLDSMSSEKRRRIARETMDVYVPIAHRLGLNSVYRELQQLAFLHLFPLRHKILFNAVQAARGNRREVVIKILESVTNTLIATGISAQVDGREKTLYSIYSKMRNKHLSFSQVLDVYGFRIVTNSFSDCYLALGVLHSLFKPMPGKFKDYIAIPKLNGYQSLHTTLIGPYGTPVEFQIRTKDMHRVAESGVAAHWLYKDHEYNLSDLQQRMHTWLQSLLDIQQQTGDSIEFLEHIKVDLFPDSVYVFTPKSKIIALPRGATALDFAYNIHTDIGDQTTVVFVNNKSVPLRTELHSGDIVQIISSPATYPSPNWLRYVRTGKARSAIHHRLRTMNSIKSQALGKILLTNAMTTLGLELDLPSILIDRLLSESCVTTMDELYIDIGIGTRMAPLVAHHVMEMLQKSDNVMQTSVRNIKAHKFLGKQDSVIISGNEDTGVQLASCCLPIPGDKLSGYLKHDRVLVVHVNDCESVKFYYAHELSRCVNVVWAKKINRLFICRITMLVQNKKTALARIATEISDANALIVAITIDDEGSSALMKYIRFMIKVKNRIHLACIIRSIRHIDHVTRIFRERI